MYLRLIIYVYILTLLVGCESLLTKDIKPNVKQEWGQMLKKKMEQMHYPFRIQAKQDRFIGKASKEDWYVKKIGSPKIQIEKKGKQITIYKDRESEVLNEEQLGIVSPRDHLLLMEEVGEIQHKSVHNISWEKKMARQVRVDIDEKKLSQKIKKRFSSDQHTQFFPKLSDQVRVVYHLIYLIDTQTLKQMKIHIQPKNGMKQEIIYSF
ncbi:hypothetical protein [Thermoflavimicrobium daqui]|uniref:Lipoprotein n=1 Tax=Thermoflavimicrobium daqui TaxID=2137476 RepID=A0A364K0G8_9BACL|nr:hypothetical protein [Thermoflavimicrobium daqui]RAL20844.1 hypothetical protein DL897_17575 [Thermoflavimicrobium daqui]